MLFAEKKKSLVIQKCLETCTDAWDFFFSPHFALTPQHSLANLDFFFLACTPFFLLQTPLISFCLAILLAPLR